ncbi:MAG: hypothetical protein WBG90_21920 [Saonia sp.]
MQDILKSVLFAAAFAFAVSSCKDPNTRQSLFPEQIEKIHQFVGELNKSLSHFEFDFVKKAWSHDSFKRRIGKLGNTGHGVFNHIYETSIKSYILNFNLNLINKVKHSGAVLKHIKTNIVSNYAEATYLLIEESYYYFIKYRIEIDDDTPYLTDVYVFKDDQWYSNKMREMVLLNLKHTATSPKRHQANRAFGEFQSALDNNDYEYAFNALSQIPESHRIFNYYKIARINTAALLGDSTLIGTIEEENDSVRGNNIYVDYLIAFYLKDSTYQEDVNIRMRKEMGIPKLLLDSLYSNNLIWE